MNTVFCPLLNRRVDGTTCLEIVLVADGEINERVLPDEMAWNDDKRETCLCCKWHADIE